MIDKMSCANWFDLSQSGPWKGDFHVPSGSCKVEMQCRGCFFSQQRKIQWCEALSSISRSRRALRANLKVSTFHVTLTMYSCPRLALKLHIWESGRQRFRSIFEVSDSANMSLNDRRVELYELIWPVSVRSLKRWISCSKWLVQGGNAMQKVIFLAAA